MKKAAVIIFCFIILLVSVSCSKNEVPSSNENVTTQTVQKNEKQQKSRTIRIGVFEPQSGVNAQSGKQYILAVQYAKSLVSKVTVGKKKYDLKLDVVDAGTSAQSAKRAAQKLVSDGVSIVLGCHDSDILKYAADVFQKAGITVIDYSQSGAELRKTYSNIFHLAPSDYDYAKKSAAFAHKNLSAKKICIISQLESVSSQSQAFYFKESFEAYGGKTETFFFNQNAADFSTIISKAKKGSFDMIYAPISLSFASEILDNMTEVSLNIPIIGGAWNSLVTSKQQNVFISSAYKDLKNDKLNAGFSKWLSEDKDLFYFNGSSSKISEPAVLAFDAYNLAVKAIKKAQSKSSKAISSALAKTTYSGKTGKISFDANVNRNALPFIVKIS